MSKQNTRTLLEWYKETLEEEREALRRNIGSGSCQDFAQYQYYVGLLSGLDKAEGLMLDLVKRIMTNDDD